MVDELLQEILLNDERISRYQLSKRKKIRVKIWSSSAWKRAIGFGFDHY